MARKREREGRKSQANFAGLTFLPTAECSSERDPGLSVSYCRLDIFFKSSPTPFSTSDIHTPCPMKILTPATQDLSSITHPLSGTSRESSFHRGFPGKIEKHAHVFFSCATHFFALFLSLYSFLPLSRRPCLHP